MTARILVACSPGERRVAVEEDGVLLDYAIERPGLPLGVGDLHRGRIAAIVPAMAGAFVVLDSGEGFLPDSEGAKGRTEGDIIGVRVTRAPQGGKGPRLTARLTSEEEARVGAGAPSLLQRGPGAIQRLAAQYPDAEIMVDDAAVLADLRVSLRGRLTLVGAAFDLDTEAEVESLGESEVTLRTGARLLIFPTPALIAIDVDSGGAAAGRDGKSARHLAVNRSVLPEIARQIRLRNLSGAILIDFAGLSPRRRDALGPDLRQALSADRLGPRFLGFTHLGLAEIVRPRVHPALHEVLAGPHAAGLAALRCLAREVAADPAARWSLRASPGVVEALRRDPVALEEFAHRSGRHLGNHGPEGRRSHSQTPRGQSPEARRLGLEGVNPELQGAEGESFEHRSLKGQNVTPPGGNGRIMGLQSDPALPGSGWTMERHDG